MYDKAYRHSKSAVPLLITHQQGQTGLSIAALAVDLAVDWLVWLC